MATTSISSLEIVITASSIELLPAKGSTTVGGVVSLSSFEHEVMVNAKHRNANKKIDFLILKWGFFIIMSQRYYFFKKKEFLFIK